MICGRADSVDHGVHTLIHDAEPPKDHVFQNLFNYHNLFRCYQILPPLFQFCRWASRLSTTKKISDTPE